jgi:hypothetical protein
MIRIVGLALFGLFALGLLAFGVVAALELSAGQAPSTAVNQAAVVATGQHEMLATDDKRPATAFQLSEPEAAILANLSSLSSVTSPLATSAPQPEAQPVTFPKLASRHWRDPYAAPMAIKTSAKPVTKLKTSKRLDRHRPRVTHAKPCQCNAIGTLLKSLKLSSDCWT